MRREIKLNSFGDLLSELGKIEKARELKTTGVWSVYQILQHMTDLLHGSIHGYHHHMPKIVRMTVGKYIFKKIMKTGVMKPGHKNPNAPTKREDAPILPAIQRLRSIISEYENYTGRMAMHPVFDKLTKEEWTKLHLIHFAMHLSFITVSETAEGSSQEVSKEPEVATKSYPKFNDSEIIIDDEDDETEIDSKESSSDLQKVVSQKESEPENKPEVSKEPEVEKIVSKEESEKPAPKKEKKIPAVAVSKKSSKKETSAPVAKKKAVATKKSAPVSKPVAKKKTASKKK